MSRITRWDEWFSKENLDHDRRILASPTSLSGKMAAKEFRSRGKKQILDLACGVGRDTFYLETCGLTVTGVDASHNGLKAANANKGTHRHISLLCTADGRQLPFANNSFDGVYCFGLLHEFTSPSQGLDVSRTIDEARRVLRKHGLIIITAAAGDPQAGLPQVQLFTREMFLNALKGWTALEIQSFDDIGCTNRTDYHIWYGVFDKTA